MSEEEFNSKGMIWVLFVIVMVVAAFALGTRFPDSQLRQDSLMLKQYKQGFEKCTSYCLDNGNLTGYLRAVSEIHHKCFCYNITDNSIKG